MIWKAVQQQDRGTIALHHRMQMHTSCAKVQVLNRVIDYKTHIDE
jgi:hypothetical protein